MFNTIEFVSQLAYLNIFRDIFSFPSYSLNMDIKEFWLFFKRTKLNTNNKNTNNNSDDDDDDKCDLLATSDHKEAPPKGSACWLGWRSPLLGPVSKWLFPGACQPHYRRHTIRYSQQCHCLPKDNHRCFHNIKSEMVVNKMFYFCWLNLKALVGGRLECSVIEHLPTVNQVTDLTPNMPPRNITITTK